MEQTLSEKAYHRLRQMLASGELTPGERLVNRSLADRIGMSFTPVREAINQLSSEGFVEYRRGSGAFVREPCGEEIAQLYDLRTCLEPFAAAQAAVSISPADVESLQHICGEWLELAKLLREKERLSAAEFIRWLDLEEKFHELVIRASGNRWLIKISIDLRVLATTFAPQRSRPHILDLAAAANTWRTHMELVRHLQSGDSEQARAWMAEHIRRGRNHVLSRLEAPQAPEATPADGGGESPRGSEGAD